MTNVTEQPKTIAAAVNSGVTAKAPAGVTAGNTKDLVSGYFHGIIYGETDARKTSTAAAFGGPEKTLILLTRSKEQLRPLQSSDPKNNYHYLSIGSGEGLEWAMQFPEKAADVAGFPQWKDLEDHVLMIDDMSEGANLLVDDKSVREDGREVKDGRQIYKATNDSIRDLVQSMKRKPMHLAMTALATVKENSVTNEETIYPLMPSGVRSLITAEMEYVFYVKKSSWKMLTTTSFISYKKKDEFGKDQVYRREIFAKNKLPKELIGQQPPVIRTEEDLDLAGLWKRIKEAKR